MALTTEVTSRVKVSGIAVSTAGVVGQPEGMINYSGYTIPGYTGTPIKKIMQETFHLPCEVLNDVNAASYGEYWKGFQEGARPISLGCLTIGTGVGGAFVLDGKLYTGFSGMAGEIGYLPLKSGMFQEVASTTALLAAAKRVEGIEWTGEAFFEELKQTPGGPYEAVFNQFIDDLASGILMMIYMMNPECIVLGGGIMAQADRIIPRLEEALKKQAIDERFLTAQIIPATLGNNAGMLGALYYLIQQGR